MKWELEERQVTTETTDSTPGVLIRAADRPGLRAFRDDVIDVAQHFQTRVFPGTCGDDRRVHRLHADPLVLSAKLVFPWHRCPPFRKSRLADRPKWFAGPRRQGENADISVTRPVRLKC